MTALHKNLLELAVVKALPMSDPSCLERLVPRIERLLPTAAAKAQPDACFTLMLLSRLVPAWFGGDGAQLSKTVVEMGSFLCSACKSA